MATTIIISENDFLRLIIQTRNGCFNHLRCYCDIEQEIETLREGLGTDRFEVWKSVLCQACPVTPGDPVPPQDVPPPPLGPVDEEDDTVLVPLGSCSRPQAARYQR